MTWLLGALKFLLPAQVLYLFGGSTFMFGLAVVGLYMVGGQALVTNVANVAGEALKPLAVKAGTVTADVITWFGEGMAGIWDKPQVLVPLVLALGIGVRYVSNADIQKTAAAVKSSRTANAELVQCRAELRRRPVTTSHKPPTAATRANPSPQSWSNW